VKSSCVKTHESWLPSTVPPSVLPGLVLASGIEHLQHHAVRCKPESVDPVMLSIKCIIFQSNISVEVTSTSPGPEKLIDVLETRPGRTILCTRTPSSPSSWPLAFSKILVSQLILCTGEKNGYKCTQRKMLFL